MMHQLRKNIRGWPRGWQVRIQRQNHHPLLNPLLKCRLLLQVLAGMQIQFLSLQTLFQGLTKMLLTHTGNTGDKSVPDLAATTDFKIGTNSACLPSTLPAYTNNWAVSLLINPPSLISTGHLVLFCATPKRVPSSTITPLPTIIWCWNSLFWSPIKTI